MSYLFSHSVSSGVYSCGCLTCSLIVYRLLFIVVDVVVYSCGCLTYSLIVYRPVFMVTDVLPILS